MSSMHETPDPTPAGSPPPPAPPPALPPAAEPRRFLRSREDRLIGGVAGGLGRTFGIDPVLFRIVFVALLFVGGVGVPLYLLTLLVTPSDDGTGRPAAGQSTGRRLVRAAAFAGLALAALCAVVLAAGLAGIEEELELEPAFVGDAYHGDQLREIPKTLRDAIEHLDESTMLRNAFGNAAVDHYVHTARWEQGEYDRRITDWELKRGFERS